MCVCVCGLALLMTVCFLTEEHQLLLGPDDGEKLFPDPAHTQLVRWKHSTLQEVQVIRVM